MPRNRLILVLAILVILAGSANAQELRLEDLVSEALANNQGMLVSKARQSAASFRPSQQRSLPDPMVMFGYQNEGWERYTYGEMPDAQWMFSLSQTIPFPGKRSLKGKVAEREAEGLDAQYNTSLLRVATDIKERYFDLFLIYKSRDLLEEKRQLLLKVEDAALGRYSAGKGPQQEVLMAQAEKYMIDERLVMLEQRLETQEAMLNTSLGRGYTSSHLGRPAERAVTIPTASLEQLVLRAYDNSPEIIARQKMLEASKLEVSIARKEYYPDFTLTGSYFARGGAFEDMWSLTTSFSIPIFLNAKQRSAERESMALRNEAEHELESAKQELASAVRENYAMAMSASRIMSIYMESLIPKSRQTFESTLSGYITGKSDLGLTIRSLSTLLDNELFYWTQYTEHEKAMARIESLTGSLDNFGGNIE